MLQIWTEKYRPKKLDEVAGQEEIIKRLEGFVERKSIPNLLFAGMQGTGKTTTAHCLVNELNLKNNFIELNASDERGIDTIRVKIKDFARTKPMGGAEFKIILLDEADALTRDAQQALRRTMENYSETCRFILDCNYSSKIIEPIQSRCVMFRFKPLREEDAKKYLNKIAEGENLRIDEKAAELIFKECKGDLRRATNILQAAASIDKNITEEVILNVIGKAKTKDVQELLNMALEGEFLKAREKLFDLMINQGVSAEDLLKQIYSNIYELEIPDDSKIKIIKLLGDYEFRVVEGSNPMIQLEAFLANLKE